MSDQSRQWKLYFATLGLVEKASNRHILVLNDYYLLLIYLGDRFVLDVKENYIQLHFITLTALFCYFYESFLIPYHCLTLYSILVLNHVYLGSEVHWLEWSDQRHWKRRWILSPLSFITHRWYATETPLAINQINYVHFLECRVASGHGVFYDLWQPWHSL